MKFWKAPGSVAVFNTPFSCQCASACRCVDTTPHNMPHRSLTSLGMMLCVFVRVISGQSAV